MPVLTRDYLERTIKISFDSSLVPNLYVLDAIGFIGKSAHKKSETSFLTTALKQTLLST